MLIYNYRKEFIEATQDTLSRLGYNNAQELQEDAVDIADLFENRPGFVHNFKNFSWIDFILHSEQDNLKARIRCNGKIYECGFKLDPYEIPTEEDTNGFALTLTDLIVVGDDEDSKERAITESFGSTPQKQYTPPSSPEPVIASAPMQVPTQSSIPAEFSMDDDDFSIPMEEISMPEPTQSNEPMDMPSFGESLDFEESISTPPEPMIETLSDEATFDAPEIPIATPPVPAPSSNHVLVESLDLETSSDYVYDPSIAADELGLPSDLIDEFVGDFIVQAKKFHPDLDEAINAEDFDNIQILSHKLKGVAANLRIEDALEVLTFINTSQDIPKLKNHTNYLYQIVHHLEFGAETPIPENTDTLAIQEIGSEMPMENTFEIQDPEPISSDTQTTDIPSDSLDTLDFDVPPISNDPIDEAPSFTDMPTDDFASIEDSFELDIPTAPAEDNFDLDMSFDEPLASIDNQDFQSPEDDLLDLSQNTLDIPSEDPAVETSSGLLSHIDTNKFNIHEAAENLDIPMETLKSYIDDFVDQANSLKTELESALSSQNLNEVKELATQLQGMSEALNMTHASELLSTLQTTNDANEAIESAKELFIFIREL